MSVRLFIAASALLLIVNIVCGGEYQRALDGKTLVWNNNPEPDDAVSWSGKQDKDGYATGYGTLVWYRMQRARVTGSNLPTEKRVPISSYSGKMVHGKLTGAVTAAEPSGKLYHGTFVDGRRTADWTEGAPRVRRGELVEAASPGEGPARAKSAKVERSPAAKSEGAPAAEPERAPAQPLVETAPETPPTDNTPTPVSDSLRSLIAPPSSLRNDASAAPSPAAGAQPAEHPPPTSPETAGELNAAEAIELADAEARARGVNLEDYERPQVQYAAEGDKWSIAYEPKAGTANRFTVTVDEKTRKAELKK